ncbi:MAG: metalloregulator ArsR/SmtB family transcription factor [Ilumatobacteraceae bacterium]
MVVELSETDEVETDRLLHALADATRRDIVRLTLEGEHSVTDLARRYPMSFAAVQKHVAILERAHLVSKHRRGRERIVCARIETVRKVNHLLDELEVIWRGRLQRFGDVLAEAESEPSTESEGTNTT